MSLNEGLSFGLSSQHLFIRLNKCAGHLSGISFRYPWRTLLSVSFIGWSRKVNQQILTHLRRGLFKTLSNIYDEVLLLKWLTFHSLTVWYVQTYFHTIELVHVPVSQKKLWVRQCWCPKYTSILSIWITSSFLVYFLTQQRKIYFETLDFPPANQKILTYSSVTKGIIDPKLFL